LFWKDCNTACKPAELPASRPAGHPRPGSRGALASQGLPVVGQSENLAEGSARDNEFPARTLHGCETAQQKVVRRQRRRQELNQIDVLLIGASSSSRECHGFLRYD
jgi:hypothetical protein